MEPPVVHKYKDKDGKEVVNANEFYNSLYYGDWIMFKLTLKWMLVAFAIDFALVGAIKYGFTYIMWFIYYCLP